MSIPLWSRPKPVLHFRHLVGSNHLESILWNDTFLVYKLIHPSLHHSVLQYLFEVIIHSSSTSDEEEEYNIKHLHPKMFPGAHPVSLNKDDAERIFWKQEHMFVLKKDGERLIMFGIHLICGTIVQTLTGFMNRKNEIFFLPSNTIGVKEHIIPFVLEGELCFNKHTLEYNYLVFELMLCNGHSLNHFGLVHREEIYRKMIEENNIVCDQENYKLRIYAEKHFHWFQYEQLLVRREETLYLYNYDGLCVIHSGKRWLIGNDPNTYKIKDVHTLDFRMKRHPLKQQFLELWVTESFKKEIKYVEQDIVATGLDIDRNYDWDNKIYECEYDISRRLFVAKKQRQDKLHVNSLRTVEKTMYTIEHNLKVDDVYELWKKWNREQQEQQNQMLIEEAQKEEYILPFVLRTTLLEDSNWRSENLSNEALIEEMKSPLLSWEVEENAQRESARRELQNRNMLEQQEYLSQVTTIAHFKNQFKTFVAEYLQQGDSVLFA
jgi:mRNA capping enzyme, catalytic domain/mRNA capping enzyme, C-terminal domain